MSAGNYDHTFSFDSIKRNAVVTMSAIDGNKIAYPSDTGIAVNKLFLAMTWRSLPSSGDSELSLSHYAMIQSTAETQILTGINQRQSCRRLLKRRTDFCVPCKRSTKANIMNAYRTLIRLD